MQRDQENDGKSKSPQALNASIAKDSEQQQQIAHPYNAIIIQVLGAGGRSFFKKTRSVILIRVFSIIQSGSIHAAQHNGGEQLIAL